MMRNFLTIHVASMGEGLGKRKKEQSGLLSRAFLSMYGGVALCFLLVLGGEGLDRKKKRCVALATANKKRGKRGGIGGSGRHVSKEAGRILYWRASGTS